MFVLYYYLLITEVETCTVKLNLSYLYQKLNSYRKIKVFKTYRNI